MTDKIRRLLFPSSLQEMAAWADIYKDEEKHDKSRNNILIYKHVSENDTTMVFPVVIRLHGILEQFRVDHFGNWSRLIRIHSKVDDVQRVVQYIHLSPGGHEAAWNATIASLNLANDYVSRRLGILMQEIVNNGCMYLQRRVFYKVNTTRASKEPRLKPEDDPAENFYRIQEWWSVAQALQLAELTAEGKKVPINAILLTEGDFVEVSVKLDFVVNRNRNTRTTIKCFLTCTYMVRMMPAREVQNQELVGNNTCKY
ncbi:uncharacterized protein EDB93DRAFT_1077972 [Suillus bovinus]|uniref:uncharacterized protein n=1 Tax=Suillus bovinus TaxID=48563 RepID=UPI001B876F59|nr:uncharacterized protein EDB93DRAFT_1077972 [Suillus bovinus]KAG2158084.1 hypothetical protein EDB93DRAFT_1077972 [Suillus bovinus]